MSACDRPVALEVTSTADGGRGSLRAAIGSANAGAPPVERIELATGTYELTRCGSDDSNSAGDLDLRINRPITLVATGPDVIIRQTCPGERVLDQHGSGLLTLQGVTITGGSVTSANPAEAAVGGGVRSAGDVTLTDATIRDNSVNAADGSGTTPGGAAYGGGLHVGGALIATNSRLIANSATGGAGVDAPLDGTGIDAGAAEGGGAYVLGAITVSGGAITQNRAQGGKGGDGLTPGDGGSARGAGIAQATTSTAAVNLQRATLTSNHVEGGNAGHTSTGTPNDFKGEGAGGGARGGAVAAAGALTAKELNARNNVARGGGSGTNIDGKRAIFPSGFAQGGALHGMLTVNLEAGTFSENRAESGDTYFDCFYYLSCGGGFAGAAAGGGVWAGGDVQVTEGTYAGNITGIGTGVDTSSTTARGGAIATEAALTAQGGEYTGNRVKSSYGSNAQGGALSAVTLNASGSRFTSNEAGSEGGAMAATTATLVDVVASQNKAYGVGGGAVSVSGDAAVTRSKFTDNVVSVTDTPPRLSGGGALSVMGRLTLVESEITKNSGSVGVEVVAGTNFIITVYGAFQGGGIRAGSVQARSSTIAENRALGPDIPSARELRGRRYPLPAGQAGGGGISATSVVLTNTTLSGNLAGEQSPFELIATRGAAVFTTSLELDHATIADNLTSASLHATSLSSRRSVVIALPDRQACGTAPTTTGSEHSWISDASCALPAATNEQRAADFFLGALADNGGPVRTRAPGSMSVLVERIPAAACTLATDARGIARPQGSACDLGAVEVKFEPGTGPADLSLAFSKQPELVGPGSDGTWQLTLQNKGPSASTPAVRIDVPEGISATSSSGAGASCRTSEGSVECVWNSAIPSGSTATLTLVGRVEAALGTTLTWRARIIARDLQPPLEDDDITLETLVNGNADITTYFFCVPGQPGEEGALVDFTFYNNGPWDAVGTEQQPIEVIFNAAPGVTATALEQTRFVGSFPQGEIGHLRFRVSATGTVPAVLGTIEVRAPASRHNTSAPVEIIAADIEARAERVPSDDPALTAYRLSVTNKGPANAKGVLYRITYDDNGFSVWQVPELAPGQTASMTGVAHNPQPGQTVRISYNDWGPLSPSSLQSLDLNPDNDVAELDLGLASDGLADLEVQSAELYPGPTPDQRILRVTIANRGPNATRADSSTALSFFRSDFLVASVTPPNSDWQCTLGDFPGLCYSAAPFAPGSTATFELLVAPLSFEAVRPVVSVYSTTADPDNTNNLRYFSFEDKAQQ